ncbi:hypothetical protein GCM10022281_21680 [Sphingomonas rosea]|uniref:Tetratricopeptide repeat protein n=1 Tax=Sphingomonas rosea TaxID=335605 RepID=A0ABP7UCP1_9SPHN
MPGGGAGRSAVRWLGVAGVVLVAGQAVRTAVVDAETATRPALAHAVWPAHPGPGFALAFTDIGEAARKGQGPSAAARALVTEAGAREPLAPEPLLVEATDRIAAGDTRQAETLLAAALHRDPRSSAAHFMLADLMIRQQRLAEALVHVGALGRRMGGATESFATALATYIRQPDALTRVAPVLGRDPKLRAAVLKALAFDRSATPQLLALARPSDRSAPWLAQALDVRIDAGEIPAARALLAHTQADDSGSALASWGDAATGPLTWRFPAGTEAAVEPAADGPMRIVYYGRAEVAVAEHRLLLPPGRYRLAYSFSAPPPAGTFQWRLTCAGVTAPLASYPIEAKDGAADFNVAPGCDAQKLSLWGVMGDFQRTVSIDLLRIRLSPLQAAS